ncbi:MAG: hypothetical protein ACRC8M_01465 [Cetobacterium sp.]|uniref:hypothetical protein n=1 Tax=Cetobacterium sp. TaxID=2071632 RepID=UPI003F3E6E67
MKKYLLGTLLVLGTMAYGQGNQVIVPVKDGNATANLNIQVEGKVFDPMQLSLVVDITAAAGPTGNSFAFKMPDVMKGQKTEALTGGFDVYLTQDGNRVEFNSDPVIKLYNGEGIEHKDTDVITPAGPAKDVKLIYTLTTGKGSNKDYTGKIFVQADATAVTEIGNYSDGSMNLRVAVTGQN